jgi:hypothetical protein
VNIPGNLPQHPSRDVITSDIPVRLDRLPWSRFHWLLGIALKAL